MNQTTQSSPVHDGHNDTLHNNEFITENLRPLSVDERLNNVFAAIKKNEFSLFQFLLATIDSKDSQVLQAVNRFYADDGPARIISRWGTCLKGKKSYDEEFRRSVTAVAVNRAQMEIRKVVFQERTLRVPADQVSQNFIEQFSMDDVEKKIRRTAPTLDQILRGLASSSCRGAASASKYVVTIGSMLLNLQSQRVNSFQMMMALYLHGTNTPKRTITALATSGLSVSYSTLQIALQNLTKEHIENIVLMMENCTYFFVWDNINIAERKLDQRIGNKDDFISGTTSSIAFDKDLKDLKIIHTPKGTLTLDIYDLDEKHCISYR
ncbi:hypothetical protein CPB97_010399 [Podila verticillata]|nr:hypothetical protein CPB97_010399 [Podila verticillata]